MHPSSLGSLLLFSHNRTCAIEQYYFELSGLYNANDPSTMTDPTKPVMKFL